MLLLIFLLGSFISLNCTEMGNPPGGPKIVEVEQKSQVEQALSIANLPHDLEKLILEYHGNDIKPVYRAYISSFSHSKNGRGVNRTWDLNGTKCYYNRPTYKFNVLFENPVDRNISDKFANYMKQHGKFVYFDGYHLHKGQKNGLLPFTTTMDETEFQDLVDQANKAIN